MTEERRGERRRRTVRRVLQRSVGVLGELLALGRGQQVLPRAGGGVLREGADAIGGLKCVPALPPASSCLVVVLFVRLLLLLLLLLLILTF
eukprot:944220-Pyramimonas_sp.AAC.1